METAPLRSFATWARAALIREVTARVAVVLAPASPERIERSAAVEALEQAIDAVGGGDTGRAAVADRVAYTWFNRIVALRFMDANGYTGIGVVSPQAGVGSGQPEILAEAKRGSIDATVVGTKTRETVTGLLNDTRRSEDPQGEAYALLLADYCRYWNRAMPFMFEREGDFTELLIPANLLADDSVLNRAVTVLTADVCQDVEVIGWLYQFYISERKDEVFAGFKRNKKAGAAEIPAATQLFTPHWIVRYLVENSLGRLWMLNRPSSRVADQMEYYLAPVDDASDFLRISGPEELKIIDPACGSGHMLTYAFDLLYAIYEEEGYAPADIPGLILTNNLYGTEIDRRAGALAAFALMMKARARQRTFFNKQVEPSICVLEPLAFSPEELDLLITGSGDRSAEADFWNRFACADTFGSLVRSDQDLAARLTAHLHNTVDDGDMLFQSVIERARRVVVQATFLADQYAVVIANPPYMSTGSMDTRLSEFVKAEYPRGKADLYACFILRCLELCRPKGRVAMVTMHSWMFLSSYTKLREAIAQEHKLESLAHLGTGAFDTIGGEVVSTTAFVVAARTYRESVVGTYVRLVHGANESEKAAALRAVSSGASSGDVYRVLNANMAALPGGAIAYWMSPTLLHAMTGNTLLGEISEPRCGMNTGENARFVRNWWEVDRGRSFYDAESTAAAHKSGCKWFPYNKGGSYRKWYGNQQSVVAFDAASYDILSKQGNHLPSRQYYFQPAVSWSKVAGSSPSFRYFPPGFVFDGAGMSLFADTPEQRMVILGLLNSNVSLAALEAIAPTLNFQSGDIARLPLPKEINDAAVMGVVEKLVASARSDWDRQEISWNFSRDPLVEEAASDGQLSDVYDAVTSRQDASVDAQRQLEEANNSFFIDAFEMRAELSPSVGVAEVTLLANPNFRYGPARAGDHRLRCADAVSDLVSYAVGCMFGRYSLDRPGLVLADQGATVRDYLAEVPAPTFAPDADNVIPVVDGDWFEDDIVGRFREFLRAAFGEQHFEENLRFVSASLEVKDIRDYFVKSFYKDHVQRYKKRPVYWLFASPKGSFNTLVYMHRYTPSTVSTVLNEYLREFTAKLTASLRQQERLAAGGGTPRQQAAAQKEADRLRKVLLELEEYEHDVLYPLASRQLSIDLDDGVKVNYPKFGAALKRIPGLEASDE
ncbi:BREX-1 system adenine-specific DNA-methyltransferase PglX [Dactylosporangium roseum]|uniref:site-specific DNA-methyltransferase (adenine-specific) n=1 Tax=Dactylosporangium roseum TaxID=47989 RepID=A0ABY5Z4U8_9ACTN|nr:BREX-1 system adenine-specific DNA-methyltransferase PglX [Dactylosporangium roseum]UWZ37075.1 BREX-1 system adenine-specific DNA-methyltransferase PglX [Dactylosporangium roseum]